MRALLAVLVVSLPAAAQLNARGAGQVVHLTLDVPCALNCAPGDPVTYETSEIAWRYSANDAGGGLFAQPTLDGGHFEVDAPAPEFGTALTFEVAATCACGAGDSGVQTLTSAPVPIAPVFDLPSQSDVSRGAIAIVHGFPQGDEHIELTYSGAGIDGGLNITHTGADFTGGMTTTVLAPTEPGTITFRAVLQPYAVSTTATQNIVAGSDSDAVDSPAQKSSSGCSSAPELLAVSVLLLASRTRRARRA